MRVLAYALRRMTLILPVIIGVSILTFIISNCIPGDPARMAAGPKATADVIAELREKLGLDLPLYVQYLRYMSNLTHLRLGTSIMTQREVSVDILERFPATLELSATAMLLAVVVGIPFGIISASRRDQTIDQLSRVAALSGVAVPSFWLGMMLILVFYLRLGVLPGGGRIGIMSTPPRHITGLYTVDALLTGQTRKLLEAISHLILPAITQSAVVVGMITRMTRSSMLEVLQEEYIRVARAKGLRDSVVLYKHALKNAVLPVVTMIGMTFGYTLGGSVLVESVFYWPGMGQYAVQAVMYMDFPAVLGITIFIAILYALINLAVDIGYFYLDPRIKVK